MQTEFRSNLKRKTEFLKESFQKKKKKIQNKLLDLKCREKKYVIHWIKIK